MVTVIHHNSCCVSVISIWPECCYHFQSISQHGGNNSGLEVRKMDADRIQILWTRTNMTGGVMLSLLSFGLNAQDLCYCGLDLFQNSNKVPGKTQFSV